MSKERLSDTQAIGLAAFFLTASAILTGGGKAAGEDIWISIRLVMAVMVPLSFVYMRIITMAGDRSFFSFVEKTMGKAIGRILMVLFVLYSLFLGAVVLRSFSEFLFIVALTRTPQYITLILLGMLCIWAAKSGIMLLARWSRFVYPIVTAVVIVLAILCIPLVDLNNLRPVLYEGAGPMLTGAWNAFTFPMIEASLLLVPFCRLGKKKNGAKTYIIALVITSLIIIIINMRNILVLGDALTKAFYFPSYKAVGLIKLGRFFDRLEILKGMVYVTGGFMKACLCLYVASQGVNEMLGIKEDEAGVTAPVGLLMITLAASLFTCYRQLVSWTEGGNGYVAAGILGVIPVAVWIVGEVRNKNRLAKD